MPQSDTATINDTQSLNIFGQPLSIFGMPVDRETIFSDYKGKYKSRIEKRQRRLIVKTTFVKFFLHHNECVHCLTTGFSPISILEQLLTGLAFVFFKRAMFVFTDKRILHIPTRFTRTPLDAISQINYADCAHISLKGRTLIVKYKSGNEEHFPYIGRRDRKKIRVLLSRIKFSPKEAGNLKDRVYLCPSCTNALDFNSAICPTCQLDFKSGIQATLRALFIPGGGYFYSRHIFLGVLFGIVEIGVLGKLLIDWLAFRQGSQINLGLTASLLALFCLGKLIAAYHSRQFIKDFIPRHRNYTTRKI